ncbi:Ribosome_biogenesis protein Nop10 [Hexamita inflata]|uniref:Nucleolar protein 10 n=1 Tax=Hexamita inflata TaxID=28002 RepID=A0AA86RH74_9EUKA|nr:Ribosome biogenesis protein Nop10 [Hexamita inflata]CAI9955750.1 Ribosome biogenesis protein Nop10 [Hexamita inflata]CAI9970490.1 Ribosome biogenesis protein Nop10 [Hexamita inflata]CAI9978374.1 Ribosome biogenesis protein Nop10 [Hexamita inflata]
MYLNICQKCERFTMAEKCPMCGKAVVTAHPAKFSPEDKDSQARVEFQKRSPGENLLTKEKYNFVLE